MSQLTRRLLLGFNATVMAALAIAFVSDQEVSRGERRPEEVAALAAWTRDHPADWVAANAIADTALDSRLPRRLELWRAAHAHASRLAPFRPHPQTSFVRGGLFHWYELPGGDRQAVLDAAGPLLRDPQTFGALHNWMWELTGDFVYLRRNAPDTENAIVWLRDTAATYGRFADYRELREAVARKRLQTFTANRKTLTPPELVALLPSKLTRDYQNLAEQVLAELAERPLDAGNAAAAGKHADDLVAFALRHNLRPLEGLEAWIDTPAIHAPTRARLALALGRDEAASNIELIGDHANYVEGWIAYDLERSAFEAARGNATMAEVYRRRAAAGPAGGPTPWLGTCGRNEVCGIAVASLSVKRAGDPIVIGLQNAQSDEVPPYVEIFVGDTRVAEGAVIDAREFRVIAPVAGPNRVEVRLVNPFTRNRIQRRVRLS